MPTPTSIRFDSPVLERLASYVARHPGSTRSGTAARYVDEGLRMDEHPGVVFRDGAMGRRAVVVGGPDVWEVVRAARSARTAEPELSETELIGLLESNTGTAEHMIRTALGYWAVYSEEIDALIRHADDREDEALTAVDRTRTLLAP